MSNPPEGPPRQAVLLLAHGTPESLDEIPEYLNNITGGRKLPPAAIEEIRRRYSLTGPSPLTQLTLEQAELLESRLGVPVYTGMRNWKPYIADTMRRMRADGVTAATAICLAPQNSRTSVGLYHRAVLAGAQATIALDFIEGWADHPLLAEAFAARLRPVREAVSKRIGAPAPVLFTAHSVPCRTVSSAPASAVAGHAAGHHEPERAASGPSPAGPDPYSQEAKRTAANVAARSGVAERDWFFAFQSQGMSGEPWIGPTVEDTLSALRREGKTVVVFQPVGFLSDHVEILYDIDIAFHDFAADIGLEIVRVPSLNDSLLLTAALADLAQQGFARLEQAANAPSSAPSSTP